MTSVVQTVVKEATATLEAALKGVGGLRYFPLGANVDPPGLVLGPPMLERRANCFEWTDATFSVFIVVGMDDRALERLQQFVTPVADALDAITDAVVRTATPGVYNSGSQDLPCYTLNVEVSL